METLSTQETVTIHILSWRFYKYMTDIQLSYSVTCPELSGYDLILNPPIHPRLLISIQRKTGFLRTYHSRPYDMT